MQTAIGVIAIATCVLVSCAAVRTPPPTYDLRSVGDPQIVERGRYLVYGPAHCAACHSDPARESEMRQGRDISLSGGRVFDLGPLGSISVPNITSDPVAGIGALSDDTLVRSLRYGISRHGKPLIPFMSFADLADDDLQAILSFLRTLPPSERPAPPTDLSWLGVVAVKFALDPKGPTRPIRRRVLPERSAEYGRYLARTVANCRGCHTRRNKLTGSFIGHEFAGGMEFQEHGRKFVAANLTPVAMGVVSTHTEQQFIERFRTSGRRKVESPMPWDAFARMTDSDLGAIYQYLKTLPPAQDR